MTELVRFLSNRRPTNPVDFSKLPRYKNRDHQERGWLPFIQSPVDKNIYEVLDPDGTPNLQKMRSRGSDFSSISTSGGPILYKSHHESSTIELFYDLFFVANLATFTTMHEHSDAESVQTYLGCFTLLWFTWLNTALYDVRFGTDSLVERFFKLAHFGIMTAFVFCGPIFDNSRSSLDGRAYRAFAVVMAISHAVHIIQYTIVLIQSIRYRSSRIPLGLTILVHVACAIGFAVSVVIFDGDELEDSYLSYWYILKIASGVLTILISVFWRVISFKNSHITERVSLVTLIVIGEGVLGLSKSVSCIFQSQSSNNVAEVGTLVSSVLLLYLFWMLYFDQLDEEATMGTIRQQFWALLHYPLHVSILLTVEGSTALIVWNSAVQGFRLVWSLQPEPSTAPSASFASNAEFVGYLDSAMERITAQFTKYSFLEEYDWKANLTTINEYATNVTFNSLEYNTQVTKIVDNMFLEATAFVFKAHDSAMGLMIKTTNLKHGPVAVEELLEAMYENYDVVTLYFYVAAGCVPLILATMYWFGKPHRGRSQLGGPLARIFVGFGLITAGCFTIFSDKSTHGYKFEHSNWLVPTIAMAYMLIIALDSLFTFVGEQEAWETLEFYLRRPTKLGSVSGPGGRRLSLLPFLIPQNSVPRDVPPRSTPRSTPRNSMSRNPAPKAPHKATPLAGSEAEREREMHLLL